MILNWNLKLKVHANLLAGSEEMSVVVYPGMGQTKRWRKELLAMNSHIFI